MIRILLCDDDQSALAVLNDLIAGVTDDGSWKLLYANSLAELIAICTTEKPHITFTDVKMIGSTEDEVLAALPDLPPPVIITTGIPAGTFRPGKGMSFLAECFAAGAKDYLEKGTPRFDEARRIMMRTILTAYAPAPQPG